MAPMESTQTRLCSFSERVSQAHRLTALYGRQLAVLAPATRIADGYRTFHINRHSHHLPKVGSGHRCGDTYVRYGTQIRQIQQTVVRRSIVAHYARTIDTEHYVHLAYRYVVDDIVVRPLQER